MFTPIYLSIFLLSKVFTAIVADVNAVIAAIPAAIIVPLCPRYTAKEVKTVTQLAPTIPKTVFSSI